MSERERISGGSAGSSCGSGQGLGDREGCTILKGLREKRSTGRGLVSRLGERL